MFRLEARVQVTDDVMALEDLVLVQGVPHSITHSPYQED